MAVRSVIGISKGLVEAHGGKLYYNKNCDNTQFVVELPVSEIGFTKKIA